jgi:hypothetical protein
MVWPWATSSSSLVFDQIPMRFSTSRRSTAVTADRSTVELRADLEPLPVT